jgi:vacuolar-type H+-ATPase subunit I/STV1
METLVINVPSKKSALVKQILKGLGVTIKSETTDNLKPSDYASRINISKEEAQNMLKDIEQSRAEWERDI